MDKFSLRFPRLDTLLMLENFIRENSGKYKKVALWKRLPKKMMYQTFALSIQYLLYSKKIAVNESGLIIWIMSEIRNEKRYNSLFQQSNDSAEKGERT